MGRSRVKATKPLHTFRVYPGSRRGRYFKVQVFKTRADMRKYCDKTCNSEGRATDAAGLCHCFKKVSYRKGKRGIVSKHIGDIHFAVTAGIEIVSHEMTHAAFYSVTEVGKEHEVLEIDEPLALAQGRLTYQATAALHDLGVWK